MGVERGGLITVRAGHAGAWGAVFLRARALLEGLGGALVGEDADLELVVAEEVGVVGGGEVGGQLVNLGLDRLAEGLSKVLDLGLVLGCPRCGWQGRTPVPGSDSPQRSRISLVCTKIPPTFKTPTAARMWRGPSLGKSR